MAIAVLAGLRFDRLGAACGLRARLGEALIGAGATTLVSGATCGADLLALDVAGEFGLRRCVVLPYGVERFRERFIEDRPGDWAPLFDTVVAAVSAAADLTILDLPPAGANPDERTNEGILTRALALAAGSGASAEAFAVWDGPADGGAGHTRHFVRTAQWLGMRVTSIPIEETQIS
jgi:hypothetical protein